MMVLFCAVPFPAECLGCLRIFLHTFPFLDVMFLVRQTSYGGYISPLIHFARVSSHVDDFNTRNKVLTPKLLKQGYRYHKFVRHFQTFISCILT